MSDVGTQPGFSVAPDLAGDAYAKIGALQDAVGEMVREAEVLGRTVPLGSGYAGEIGQFMAEYGIGGSGSAVEQLTAFGRELARLKKRVGEAVTMYQHQDDAAADGVDCSGG